MASYHIVDMKDHEILAKRSIMLLGPAVAFWERRLKAHDFLGRVVPWSPTFTLLCCDPTTVQAKESS